MKYLSIDIETTGLNCETDQLLSMAALYVDHKEPGIDVDKLPMFHCYILHERLSGHPKAFVMNAELIEYMLGLSHQLPLFNDQGILQPDPRYLGRLMFGVLTLNDLWKNFESWINCFYHRNDKIVIAGKNPNFDMGFLSKMPGFNERRFHHRKLDPAMLFTNLWEDKAPAGTEECAERAGIKVAGLHNEIMDAKRVVMMFDKGFQLKKE